MSSRSRFRHACAVLAAILLCLNSRAPIAHAQLSQFLGAANQNFTFGELSEPVPFFLEEETERLGKTPPNVVIDTIIPIPLQGDPDKIVLRNIGGQPENITGWKLRDSGDEMVFEMGPSEACPNFEILDPAGTLVIESKIEENRCGFEFDLGIKDEIRLLDSNDELVSELAWNDSNEGDAFKRTPEGDYIIISEKEKVLDILHDLGNFKFFLEALKVTGLAEPLNADSDPDFPGPFIPEEAPPPEIAPQFPSHFGFAFNRSSLPPPPPPPAPPSRPKPGVPKKGPYTILAPNDEAFESLRFSLAGSGNPPFTKRELLALPELKDILLYHILGGNYTTDILFNNTGIFTSRGAEVTAFKDPVMTEGSIMLHDSCIDKPTPDVYDCEQQDKFGKCHEPFMVSPLASQWRGGFCERSCQRCTCDFGFCSTITMSDIQAQNGVVHLIDRILFPPPIFEKEEGGLEPESEEGVDFEAGLEGAGEKPSLTIGFKPITGEPSTSGEEGVTATGR